MSSPSLLIASLFVVIDRIFYRTLFFYRWKKKGMYLHLSNRFIFISRFIEKSAKGMTNTRVKGRFPNDYLPMENLIWRFYVLINVTLDNCLSILDQPGFKWPKGLEGSMGVPWYLAKTNRSEFHVFILPMSGEEEREGGREQQRTRRGFDRDPMVFYHTPLIRRITRLDNDCHYSPMGPVFTVPRFLR